MGSKKCVACGAKYNGQNHKCSGAVESARKAANTKAVNEEIFYADVDYKPRQPSLRNRLSDGFAMLGDY